MKQTPQREPLTPSQLAALLDGLLAVCRARDRGEPYWMLDVRRAQARIAALRARRAQPPC